MKNKYVIENVTIVNAGHLLSNSDIAIENGKITAITQVTNRKPATTYALPGFIDMHIHGAGGADVMDAVPEALSTIASSLLRQGTTSFLATTMTASTCSIEQALANVASYNKDEHKLGAEILGVHLEGPFLHPKAAGAQNSKHMLHPDLALFRRWQQVSNGKIKLMTVASEYSNSAEFIKACVDDGVLVGLGHTHAPAEMVDAAISAGASYATHLFNAMSGLHHRHSGAAYPLLLSDQVTAELIADGFHISPWAAQLAWRVKQAKRLVLVSDSMRARCLGPGIYDLGEQAVTVNENGMATLPDGTLAGSVLDQLRAAQWMRQTVGCNLQDIARICSANQAKLLGVADRKGCIAVGMDADLVLVKSNLEWVNTICRGRALQEFASDAPVQVAKQELQL